jgi:ubiquinol-cytochrome c reductase subunit 8
MGAGAPSAKTYMGWWGSLGSQPQKGITTYAVSPYAQRPLKGAAHNAVFNVFRRVKNQALFIAVPGFIIWEWWVWARDYNEYLYTKAGREELEIVNA